MQPKIQRTIDETENLTFTLIQSNLIEQQIPVRTQRVVSASMTASITSYGRQNDVVDVLGCTYMFAVISFTSCVQTRNTEY